MRTIEPISDSIAEDIIKSAGSNSSIEIASGKIHLKLEVCLE